MAGECLSYGAFGAYNTLYNRTTRPRTVIPFTRSSARKTDSWTNFLPDVRSSTYVQNPTGSELEPQPEEYDHEAHAGLKDFSPEVTWVVKRYFPLDERTYAPVPRHKYIVKPSGVPPPQHWIPPRPDNSPEISKFTRLRTEALNYNSTPYTRDERWSTLREMLPSSGRAVRMHPPDWGSRSSNAPAMSAQPQRRFPIVNSPMSRFVSDMHLTNREFKLF